MAKLPSMEKKIKFYEEEQGIDITITWFSPIAFFLAFFTLVWFGFLVFFLLALWGMVLPGFSLFFR